MIKRITIIFSLCFSGIFNAQTNELTIRFIANCGLHITDGVSNIYFDFPYHSGFFNNMKYPHSEIDSLKPNSVFIFTHKHPDHYSRKVKKARGKIIVPAHSDQLSGLSTSIQDFSVQAFKTKHLRSSRHNSYLVTWHGKRIFISGDTEHSETIASQKDLDWAFVPAWLLTDATTKNLKIDSKMVAVYHIGDGDHIEAASPKILLLKQRGEVIRLR